MAYISRDPAPYFAFEFKLTPGRGLVGCGTLEFGEASLSFNVWVVVCWLEHEHGRNVPQSRCRPLRAPLWQRSSMREPWQASLRCSPWHVA